MTRVFYASTLFGAMSLSAAADSGLFGDRAERRLLLVADNTGVPEIGDGFDRSAGFEPLRGRFDDIVHWNDVIAPMHPAGWAPRAAEVPMLSRLLADRLHIADGVRELVVESIAVAPARTIGTLIRDCPVTVYSDGLMSYGPTRSELPTEMGGRVTRLLHLDLLPGVVPLLLREYDVEYVPIPDDAFAKVIAELAGPVAQDAVGCPVVIGQYLSRLQILTPGEEDELHVGMVQALGAAGYDHIVFKPHPAGGRTHVPAVQAAAAAAGVRLTVLGNDLPVEAWCAEARPALVVSCFSTALLTVARYFGIAAAAMGTELALTRITPYENSNRIPATIVDATVPTLRPDGTLDAPPAATPGFDVDRLVRAVGYCMQAGRLPELRSAAVAQLLTCGDRRWFKKRRLQSLGLLGASGSRASAARRAVRTARRRVTVRVRRAGRALKGG